MGQHGSHGSASRWTALMGQLHAGRFSFVSTALMGELQAGRLLWVSFTLGGSYGSALSWTALTGQLQAGLDKLVMGILLQCSSAPATSNF